MKTIPKINKYMSTSPITAGKDQTLAYAHKLLREHHIRHLPVLDGGHLVGIISDRDLHLVETLKDVDPQKVTLEDAMTPSPFTVAPDASLDDVVAEMAEKKIGSAVVVDNNKVVGVFTTIDAMSAFAELLHTRLKGLTPGDGARGVRAPGGVWYAARPMLKLNSEWNELFRSYEQDHQDPRNQACHKIGIPMILASLPLGASIVGLPLAVPPVHRGLGLPVHRPLLRGQGAQLRQRPPQPPRRRPLVVREGRPPHRRAPGRSRSLSKDQHPPAFSPGSTTFHVDRSGDSARVEPSVNDPSSTEVGRKPMVSENRESMALSPRSAGDVKDSVNKQVSWRKPGSSGGTPASSSRDRKVSEKPLRSRRGGSLSFWQRLTWWLLGALTPVMIGHGAFVYWRERELQIKNVTGELELYAQIVQRAVVETQQQRGWSAALELGRTLEPRELSFAADHRFLWVERPPGAPALEDARPELRALLLRSPAGLILRDAPDHRWRVYRLLRGTEGAVAFEVSHDARDVERFIRTTALEEALSVFVTALACALAVALVNRLQVRPVLNRLIAQARRIDAAAVEDRRSRSVEDEIALLDDEMSRMERRIAEARGALQKETSAKLAMAAQLRHADRLAIVGRLAAGVAHEFGTPLTVVRGQARLIMDCPEVPDSERRSARTIVEQVDRMSRIIRQLLDLARRRGPPQGPCDLGGLLEQVSRLLDHEASRKRVALLVEAPPEPTLARGDLQQLEQVAINLVINAIHALDSRGGVVTLRCGREPAACPPQDSGEAPGPAVWFEVEDNGPGIPDDILPVLFEPFVTTKEAGQGTGLGLPLSMGIVRDHGGWIDVQSAPDAGARFRVFLRPL